MKRSTSKRGEDSDPLESRRCVTFNNRGIRYAIQMYPASLRGAIEPDSHPMNKRDYRAAHAILFS